MGAHRADLIDSHRKMDTHWEERKHLSNSKDDHQKIEWASVLKCDQLNKDIKEQEEKAKDKIDIQEQQSMTIKKKACKTKQQLRNIKELQRFTGAQVKLMGNKPPEVGQQRLDHVFLRIIGNFNAAQVVQTRVRQVVRSSQVEENNQRRYEKNVNVANKENNAEVAVKTGETASDAARINPPEIKSKIDVQQPVISNQVFAAQYNYSHQNGPQTSTLNIVHH
uniref:Uncharacterized protein n=1 Tax=Romanomermis culicivorax TaxID=13658 RepID=A0A915HRF0_ROMCU